MEPILLESEREPSLHEILLAEEAAASSADHGEQSVLAAEAPKDEVWLSTSVEPPLNADIDLLVERQGQSVVLKGWATRRFVRGALTFWTWRGDQPRFVVPIGWRAAA